MGVILYFESNPSIVQFIAITAVTVLVLALSFFSEKLAHITHTEPSSIQEYVFYTNGIVELNNALNQELFTMGINSRIGFLGCWLQLQKVDSKHTVSMTRFIFKNSVSDYEYAQLCRMIKRNTSNLDDQQ